MEKTELQQQVADVVEKLFDKKEEAEIRKNIESELQKAAASLSDVTEELETKNAEVVDLQSKLTEENTQVQELKTELEAARKDLETANEKIGAVETELQGLKKDRLEEARMLELEGAGVVNTNREIQSVKVREMTDEDFASYKGELVSIRESVINELTKSSESAEAIAKAEKEAVEKEAAEKEAAEKEAAEKEAAEKEAAEKAVAEKGLETTPVNVSTGAAALASLNLEKKPAEEILAKYAKLGQAMASRWTDSK